MTTGSRELDALIKQCRALEDAMSPQEKAEYKRSQAIEWVYGNLTCTGRRPGITREMIAAEYDKKYGVK